jgi:hypothetical protein
LFLDQRWTNVERELPELKKQLQHFENEYRLLLGKMGDINADELGYQMEQELKRMDDAISQAAAKIQVRNSKNI